LRLPKQWQKNNLRNRNKTQKKQFEIAQNSSTEQFSLAQASAKEQFETAQNNARDQFNIEQTNARIQFNEAQGESKRQFESANCKSILALILAVISIIASPLVAKYVTTTIDKEQYNKIDSLQTEIYNKLEEINQKVVETETDTTLYIVPDQLGEISTTLKKVNNKLVKPVQK